MDESLSQKGTSDKLTHPQEFDTKSAISQNTYLVLVLECLIQESLIHLNKNVDSWTFQTS